MMKTLPVVLIWIPLIVTAMNPSTLNGQTPTRPTCEKLAASVRDTNANSTEKARAVSQVSSCPGARSILADAIRANRRSSDTALLYAISTVAGRKGGREISTAAIGVAVDNQNSERARILAIRTLIEILSPGRLLTLAELTDTVAVATSGAKKVSRNRRCNTIYVSSPHSSRRPTVSQEEQQRIREGVKTLMTDGGTPVSVRSAAECVT
jgi:hypothetical protein